TTSPSERLPSPTLSASRSRRMAWLPMASSKGGAIMRRPLTIALLAFLGGCFDAGDVSLSTPGMASGTTGTAQMLASAQDGPYAMAIDGANLYWANVWEGTVTIHKSD